MILFYSQKTISTTVMKNIVFLTFYLYFYEIQSFVPFILIGKKKKGELEYSSQKSFLSATNLWKLGTLTVKKLPITIKFKLYGSIYI